MYSVLLTPVLFHLGLNCHIGTKLMKSWVYVICNTVVYKIHLICDFSTVMLLIMSQLPRSNNFIMYLCENLSHNLAVEHVWVLNPGPVQWSCAESKLFPFLWAQTGCHMWSGSVFTLSLDQHWAPSPKSYFSSVIVLLFAFRKNNRNKTKSLWFSGWISELP